MDVPVKDENFLSSVGCGLSSQSNIIEEAKASVVIGMCVMAGWSNDAETSLLWTFLIKNMTDCSQR